MSDIDPITNNDNTIDSRDVIARIELLAEFEASDDEVNMLTDEEASELATLRALAEQGEGVADWEYGVTLVRGTYFDSYAQQYAEDTSDQGAEKLATQWPFTCIDWHRAAKELQVDYTTLMFGDVDYWVR